MSKPFSWHVSIWVLLLALQAVLSGLALTKETVDQDTSEKEQAESSIPSIKGPKHEIVKFRSGSLTIYGALWKPPGDGPFPAIIYNHGSERINDLYAGPYGRYGNVGKFYASKGFACLLPLRRGHSLQFNQQIVCTSEGELLSDRVDKLAGTVDDNSPDAVRHKRNEIWIHEQEADNEDVVAAVDWLKQQPFVKSDMIVMSGISFGGIQTLLASEKKLGVRAFIPFAPGAISWRAAPELHDRLKVALEKATAPVFLIQAANDFDLGPSEYLRPVLDRKGGFNRHKIYAAFKPEQGHKSGHSGFATSPDGIAIWSPDVLAFLQEVLDR